LSGVLIESIKGKQKGKTPKKYGERKPQGRTFAIMCRGSWRWELSRVDGKRGMEKEKVKKGPN